MASDSKVISFSAFKAKKDGQPFEPNFLPPPPMASSPKKERRQRPRIKYHFSRRPMIIVNDIAFRVVNVSEFGVKFIAPTTHIPLVDSKVNGFLYIGVSAKFKFSALVLRVIGDLVILQFDTPIPSEQFLKELARVNEVAT